MTLTPDFSDHAQPSRLPSTPSPDGGVWHLDARDRTASSPDSPAGSRRRRVYTLVRSARDEGVVAPRELRRALIRTVVHASAVGRHEAVVHSDRDVALDAIHTAFFSALSGLPEVAAGLAVRPSWEARLLW